MSFDNVYTCMKLLANCDGGVMVSIVAFQAVDPGSIPGHRTKHLFFEKFFYCKF